MSWHLDYRPKTLAEVVGQPAAVKALESMFARKSGFPHAVAFVGPSGTGKTTLAGVVRRMLGCKHGDYTEVNCATAESPIDTVREIERRMYMGPLYGKARVFYLDEVQSLSRAGFAQQGLLRMLEADDCPKTYFLLATTDPGKIIPTVMGRCTKIELKPISPGDLYKLALDVLDREGVDDGSGRMPTTIVVNKVIENSGGSARNMLVTLEKVAGLGSEEEQLEAITPQTTETQGIDLARLLIGRKPWPQVAAVLKALEDDPEKVRRVVLGYANSVLLGGGGQAPRAFLLVQVFRDNLFDCGKAGLTAACWEVSSQK